MNAHQYHPADEIVISTLPSYESNWLRGDLIDTRPQGDRPAGRARRRRPRSRSRGAGTAGAA